MNIGGRTLRLRFCAYPACRAAFTILSNDRNDAEKLARYARLDPQLLNPTEGLHLPPLITPTFGARARATLPAPMQVVLGPLLAQIDQLSQQIETYDALLEKIAAARYPVETKLLRSVPGVGPLTSLTYVLTLADAWRFAHSRDVGPYLGLQPKQRQSGERDPQLGISKAGNCYLRKLLVQCSRYILGHFGAESKLRTWGLALAARGGRNAKKRAIVVVRESWLCRCTGCRPVERLISRCMVILRLSRW